MTEHQAVLLKEAVTGLAIKPDGIYVDGTFGRGGHSRKILESLGPAGRLIAIDKDLDAIAHGEHQFATDKRLQLFQGSFAELADFCKSAGVYGQVDGILLDLGISSPQIDMPERGFSFMHDGPLDMRMDKSQDLDAETFINTASVDEMVAVFRNYGEERYSLRIAQAIDAARLENRITSTKVLAEIVKAAHPRWEKHKHPATRVFQAIRIQVNQELTDLEHCLESAIDVLAIGGRLAVISFHSLEDRMVKLFMRREAQGPRIPKGLPIRNIEQNVRFKRLGRAVKPNEEEIKKNIRARSAVLRIGERLK